jgi:hypothetical protein
MLYLKRFTYVLGAAAPTLAASLAVTQTPWQPRRDLFQTPPVLLSVAGALPQAKLQDPNDANGILSNVILFNFPETSRSGLEPPSRVSTLSFCFTRMRSGNSTSNAKLGAPEGTQDSPVFFQILS